MTAASELVVYGTPTCADCRRSRALLDARGVSYRWVDLTLDPHAAEWVRRELGRLSTPYLVLPDGSTMVEPSDDELTSALQRTGLLPA
ncbi:glutaredoxin family protein [Microbacterium sp. RD1]|uniref:glutaredoxin family protein n=1 Tax=Microbacterium sp. RD1 TaxID=3457313 RepID=UPI003FA5DCF1